MIRNRIAANGVSLRSPDDDDGISNKDVHVPGVIFANNSFFIHI